MRYLILLFVFFLNCQDNKSKKTKEPPNSLVTAKVSNIPNKEKESETAFLLNDQNVMEFFLAYDKENKENKVRITTDFGVIDIELFEATKFHRSNFIYLTKKKYFNNTQFYRVIDNFIIQGGNSDDQKTLNKRKRIGRYLLPNDHKKGYKHDRGMVSMPSSAVANPYKMASPFEFFIVQQQGGAHHLNGDYAVFGKVIAGMEVVDKIAAVPTDRGDWPQKNVYIKKVEIIN
ncbi:MAG: peptidylprolyl isomerase [Flavobacteriaceae bacterium]|nr:peptidylprolyl isomerase [Flavobacteriaceae bacterium]